MNLLLLLFVMIVKTHTEGEPLPDLPQANQIHHQVHKESLYSSMHPSTSSSSFKVIRNNGHHQQKVTSESLPSLDSRDDFRKGSRVLPSSLLQIIFAVLQTNAEEIKRLLHEVSDPFSPLQSGHPILQVQLQSNRFSKNKAQRLYRRLSTESISSQKELCSCGNGWYQQSFIITKV